MNLTPDQLAAINRHLRKSGIIYQEVYDELFDHYVNAIEGQLSSGISFDSAFGNIVRQFGGKPGLVTIQRKRSKAAGRLYRRVLLDILLGVIRWPGVAITGTALWLLYSLLGMAPHMMVVTITLMAITTIPFVLALLLTAEQGWRYWRHERPTALTLEGTTLLSRSLGLATSFFYPNLLVWIGWMKPKDAPLTSTEQLVFFVLGTAILFVCYAQLILISRSARLSRAVYINF